LCLHLLWALGALFKDGATIISLWRGWSGFQIAIVGCGSTGLLLSALLAAAGVRVSAYCFDDSRVVQLLSHGVRVVGRGELFAKVSAAHVSVAKPQYDAVIVASELNGISEALRVSGRLLRDEGLGIVLLQPSLLALQEAERGKLRVAGYLALRTCVWPSLQMAVEWTGEGEVACAGSGDVCRLLAEACRAVGLSYRYAGSDDDSLRGLAWDMMAAVGSTQPVSAVLGVGFAAVRRSSYAVQLVESLAKEFELVASQHGVRLPRPPVEAARQMLSLRGCRPKMLRDLEERRVSEIDYINGYLLQLAASAGMYTPYNMAIYLTVKALEDVMRG
jgi:2-dehydropantoate 2-reductase